MSHSKEDFIIILVEDNPIQIEWAKKELEGYDLRIFVNSEDFLDKYVKIIDEVSESTKEWIYLGDLFLPGKEGEKPDYRNGIHCFEQILLLSSCDSLHHAFGVALVSNYEHHKDGFAGIAPAEVILDENFGQMMRYQYLTPRFLIAVDEVWYGDFYSHVYLDSEAVEMTEHNWDKGVLLKPYGKIVADMVR